MTTVHIDGWHHEFGKVSLTKTLQAGAGLSLSQAKAMTDSVLEQKTVSVSLPSRAEAEALAAQLRSLGGLIVRVSD